MTGTPPLLPYGRPCLDEDDIAAVVAVLRSDFLTTGPVGPAFERALAEAVGARHAVACSSGTAALHLAALALGLGPGDAAIVPSLTFLATANAVRLTGAEVVFADVDAETGLMTPETLAEALQHCARMPVPGSTRPARARVVLPVHLGGQAGDGAAIAALAERHGCVVIEDACHALGSTRTSPHSGAEAAADGPERLGACRHALAATFSFHPVKTLTTGEGGAITTQDDALAERLRRLRNHGLTRDPTLFTQADEAFAADGRPNPWYYELDEPGLNARLSDLHAALGLSQLTKLAGFVARRRHLAAGYDAALADLAPLVRPVGRVPHCRPAWHLYQVLMDFDALGVSRHTVMTRLRAAGIGTQVHYIPVHRQPYYRARYGSRPLPGALAFYRRTLSLPLFPAMTEADRARVVAALAEASTPAPWRL